MGNAKLDIPFWYHFDIGIPMLARYTDVELIWIRCSSAIWETFYVMESFFNTNDGIGQLEVTFQNTHIFLLLRLAKNFNLFINILQ